MDKYKVISTVDNNFFIYDTQFLNIIPIEDDGINEIKSVPKINDESGADISYRISTDLRKGLEQAVQHSDKGKKIGLPAISNRKLNSIVLPITKNCNLACPYCFAKSNKIRDTSKDFSEEDIHNIIDLICTKIPDEERVNLIFFGGEPLVRTDIIKRIVKDISIRRKNIFFSITTNGTLITDSMARFMAEHKFAVLISIDGMDNEYNHRKFKNGKPSYSRAMRGLEILKKHGIVPSIRATLTYDNPYIADTFLFFENQKIPYSLIFAYESANDNCDKYVKFENSKLIEIEQAFFKVESFMLEKFKNNEPVYDSVLSHMISKLESKNRQTFSCVGGFTYYTIANGGKLYSCPHLMESDDNKYEMGNIHEFDSLKSQDFPFTPVSIDKIEECNRCWAKYLCTGGCVAQKIMYGLNNTDSLPKMRCRLEKITQAHYLRLYYHLKKHISSSENN